MDVINPPVVWVGGRCYRTFTPLTGNHHTNVAEEDAYEQDPYNDELDCQGDSGEDQIIVEEMQGGKFCNRYSVASAYFPFIIGRQGNTRKRIENETYTQITIPARGNSGDIVIVGKDKKTTRLARLRLEVLVEQARAKHDATHFLALPCATSQVQDSFAQFKKTVLEECPSARGVEESIFQDAPRLHATLGVMVLADQRERQHAIQTLKEDLQEALGKYIPAEGMKVRMQGLAYMNDDPSEVHVLYAKLSDSSWANNLQPFADSVLKTFANAGLAKRQHDRVKLHVTLLNSRYRGNSQEASQQEAEGLVRRSQYQQRESFDARPLMEKFGNWDFGEFEIKDLHLSMRHTKASDGFYVASAKLSLSK